MRSVMLQINEYDDDDDDHYLCDQTTMNFYYYYYYYMIYTAPISKIESEALASLGEHD